MTQSTSIAFVIAGLLALVIVPLVRRVAIALNLIDSPDRHRKLQKNPIALGGGVGVFTAMALAFASAIYIDRWFFDYQLGIVSLRYYHLFAAAAAILLIGFVDDIWSLRGRQKLLGQCLVIAMLVGSGTKIDAIGLFGQHLELGAFAFPLTVLWLVIAVNALNLIDGADGVAATVGGIISFGLGAMSIVQGLPLNAAVCFALSGALLGFLKFNKPPATIYLGDAGSMMVGLMVGVLAIWSNLKDHTVLSSAPIAILAIPLFDSSAAIVRRWLTGRSLYATDRAHLHHLLQQRWGDRGMLLLVVILCGSTTLISVLSVTFKLPWLAGLGSLFVLAAMIATRSFGHAEFHLAAHRLASFANSFAVTPRYIQGRTRQLNLLLQGNDVWATVWEPLRELAAKQNFASAKMDINLAWLHQGYHANWQSERMPDKAVQMTLTLPIFAHHPVDGESIAIGQLRMIAAADSPQIHQQLAALSDHLSDLRVELDSVVLLIHRAINPPVGELIDVPADDALLPDHPMARDPSRKVPTSADDDALNPNWSSGEVLQPSTRS